MRKNERAGAEVAQLRWRCRRGMRELDVLLSGWLDRRYMQSSPADQAAFAALLDQSDPELLAWLLGRSAPDNAELARIVEAISRPG